MSPAPGSVRYDFIAASPELALTLFYHGGGRATLLDLQALRAYGGKALGLDGLTRLKTRLLRGSVLSPSESAIFGECSYTVAVTPPQVERLRRASQALHGGADARSPESLSARVILGVLHATACDPSEPTLPC